MQVEMNSDVAVSTAQPDAQPDNQMSLFFVIVILVSIRALLEEIAKCMAAALVKLCCRA